LGVHERTLRRWIVDRPELRPLLRAYRHGKQWRLRVPETDAEFERYKQEVLTTIGPFHRERASRRSSFVKKKGIAFGYDGNEQREQDLFILRAATELKIANARPTRVFKARSKLAEETRTDRTSCWVGTVRIVASNYACGVKDVPNYLDRWVADESVVRRSYWQKRTKMTLVYKNEKGAVEREIEIDPKRELQRELRELKNDARQIRQDWPTREQLDKAKGLVKSNWRKRTLNEAARECADRGQRITGPNLAIS